MTDRIEGLNTLQKLIHYEFRDISLLDLALTHSSHSSTNNERLEFLGDAILDAEISRLLYETYGDANEHFLTVHRSQIVSNRSLGDVAKRVHIPELLRLGVGGRKSGIADRDSVLAGSLEAVIAAVYLDGGPSSVTRTVEHVFGTAIHTSEADLTEHPKTRLQEYMVALNRTYPRYEVDSSDEREDQFVARCCVEGVSLICEEGAATSADAETKARELLANKLAKANRLLSSDDVSSTNAAVVGRIVTTVMSTTKGDTDAWIARSSIDDIEFATDGTGASKQEAETAAARRMLAEIES